MNRGKNTSLKRKPAQAKISFIPAPRKSKIAKIVGAPIIRKELKAVDTNSVIPASTDLVVILLNGVQNGDEGYERVGRVLEAASVDVKFGLVPRPATNGVDFVRVALVWDRDPSGVLATYAEIFSNTDNAGTETSNNESFKNLETKHRFTVLRDATMNMPGYTNTAGVMTNIEPAVPNGDTWHNRWFVNLKGLQSRYKGITSDIASLEQGALYLVTAGGYAVASAPWSVNYATRFQYTDD